MCLARPHFQNTLTLTCVCNAPVSPGERPCRVQMLSFFPETSYNEEGLLRCIYKQTSLSRAFPEPVAERGVVEYALFFLDHSALNPLPLGQAWACGHGPFGISYLMLGCWCSCHTMCCVQERGRLTVTELPGKRGFAVSSWLSHWKQPRVPRTQRHQESQDTRQNLCHEMLHLSL